MNLQSIKDEYNNLLIAESLFRMQCRAFILSKLKDTSEDKPFQCNIRIELADPMTCRVIDTAVIIGMWQEDEEIYFVEEGEDWLCPHSMDYYRNAELLQIVEQLN